MLTVDLILNNIQPVMGACSLIATGIVVYRKKRSYKIQKVFLTTQFKTKFKRHQVNFNEQFKTHGLFK